MKLAHKLTPGTEKSLRVKVARERSEKKQATTPTCSKRPRKQHSAKQSHHDLLHAEWFGASAVEALAVQWPYMASNQADGVRDKNTDDLLIFFKKLHDEDVAQRTNSQTGNRNEPNEPKDLKVHKYPTGQPAKKLIVGINAVAKALEAGSVGLVAISDAVQPPILVQHLLMLCSLLSVPVASLAQPPQHIGRLLGVGICAAAAVSRASCDGQVFDFAKVPQLPLLTSNPTHSTGPSND